MPCCHCNLHLASSPGPTPTFLMLMLWGSNGKGRHTYTSSQLKGKVKGQQASRVAIERTLARPDNLVPKIRRLQIRRAYLPTYLPTSFEEVSRHSESDILVLVEVEKSRAHRFPFMGGGATANFWVIYSISDGNHYRMFICMALRIV